jgi:protein-glutamine gamma-glutamyltransferase
MYDIRQFKPSLYMLLVLGMTGYALAAAAPGIWLFSVALILLNGWLVMTGRFRPLPRLAANAITLLLFLVIAIQFRAQGLQRAVLVLGQFLVFLQLVKLYEQRANRDYAQLLVLSLLLMVAAAINTASLLFGVLFITYLFLSLYCCLLFHLKVETDYAKEAIGLSAEQLHPNTLRQDQRFLSRSMRRLTVFASMVAITMAVTVFLLFPRNTGAGLFGQMQFQPSQTLTGFSDRVSFQTVARITQNQDIVAHVRVWKNGEPVNGTQPLLLRGTTLSVYDSDGSRPGGGAWQWLRGNSRPVRERELQTNADTNFVRHDGDEWRQEITLKPTGTNTLFAMPGIVSIRPIRDLVRINYHAGDETLQNIDRLINTVQYEVVSRNDLERPQYLPEAIGYNTLRTWMYRGDVEDQTPVEQIHPRILEFVQQPEVSGVDAQGPLFDRLAETPFPSELHVRVAENIESYLRNNFSYTLDLSDAARIMAGQDPMVAFLYDLKRGHCEYFAGAMTLMCQALGMKARMVVGFYCDEFSQIGGYYIVKQSHAHAWVEVQTPTGWRTFDPTSAREMSQTAHGLWGQLRHFFDFLEYTWANSVVAYDHTSQSNMITNMEHQLSTSALASSGQLNSLGRWFEDLKRWFQDANSFFVSLSKALSILMGLMILAILVAIGWFLFEKLKLQRRARRIGLAALPVEDQLRLARQLGFYDELLRALARRDIIRPTHLTPLEFSRSISFLPTNVYDSIQRLTNLFYRIRYGRQEISNEQQRRLREVIHRLESSIPSTPIRSG